MSNHRIAFILLVMAIVGFGIGCTLRNWYETRHQLVEVKVLTVERPDSAWVPKHVWVEETSNHQRHWIVGIIGNTGEVFKVYRKQLRDNE